MLQLGGGLLPVTIPHYLAAAAVTLSAVNLTGGTIVTKKMLDMFRRKDDAPEYNEYYLLPAVAATIGSGALFATGTYIRLSVITLSFYSFLSKARSIYFTYLHLENT
jgi:NAD(P) transhydrogenase